MKGKYKQFIDSVVTVSFLYGVIYLFSNTSILAFIDNKFFNFIIVWIISIIIAVFISLTSMQRQIKVFRTKFRCAYKNITRQLELLQGLTGIIALQR
jgi:hypothetical protein